MAIPLPASFASAARPRLLDRYAAFLPVSATTPRLTLGEGFTPLVRASHLGAAFGLANLFMKVEGQNPSGSFKDRGMVLAVAKALEDGATGIICASTGNTSASASAYAAAAGLECVVVLPRGQTAAGKMLQAMVAGAHVVAIDGNFDQALDVVRTLAAGSGAGAAGSGAGASRSGAGASHPLTLVNSVNPARIEGQKTAAFEVCDDLGCAPDVLAIPVGNAGNITAYWAGFGAYHRAGRVAGLPRMCGFQAAGAAPIVEGRVIERPETVATAIRIGNPASWAGAVAARDESGGVIEAVSDEEILAAHRDVARLEGVFCEPSSAASLAGVRRMAADGRIARDELVVCVLTGNGLKDPETARRGMPAVLEAAATPEAVARALGW